jgi:chemotaxis protein CheX
MNVKFLNPFLEAAADVLHAEANLSSNRGNLSLQKSSLTGSEVTVLISIIGQVQGVVLFGMSTPTSLAIVSRIVDQQFDELNGLAQSGIAELGNVISGKATINLSNSGYQATISPPTLIIGRGAQISTLDFSRIVVPLETRVGPFIIHLAVREVLEVPAAGIGPLVASAKVSPQVPEA